MNEQQTPVDLTLHLNTDTVNLILGALGELPAKHTHQLINMIHAQVSEQLAPAEPETAPKKK